MARFHVYRLKSGDVPAIDVQANLLDDLPSRVMVPLHSVQELGWSISRLNPRFSIEGEVYVMATQRMASIPTTEIGKVVADLSDKRDTIIAALDFLFHGF
ncbi:CcdB family protein [Rhizobium lentis]|uniref:Toxin CcdB n=1 Tax=Rhizobium lentis TaxID=1138194 RepID=A0ABS7IJW1_9HYPH|nr:CcdB family protein [Rhizobium lentis]MBX4955295.1 CcdB family protein [Rhizobium lentis]MBX4972785.1 CcdB family protein [Rhizobium lentis]MBX4987078.1 CcdB family protein [Rhizobium lentis]MBX5005522.1 CcdB family protein [Rhizobium lentis]MBX5028632.1 CcdB family protein [Rhizobium lentis]